MTTNAEQIYNLLDTKNPDPMSGGKIQAIKLLRESARPNQLGLKEAKDIIDATFEQTPEQAIQTLAAATGEANKVGVFINRAVEIVARGDLAFKALLTDRALSMTDAFGNKVLIPAELLDDVIEALKTFRPEVARGGWA